MYFYSKDNSNTCTLEALSFIDNINNFKELGAVVIGVSPDSVESHKNFAHKHNLDLILLSDPEHIVLNHYNVWRKKKLYGKEYMGVERTTFLINPKGYIEEEWTKVRVKSHVEKVKTSLSELVKS